MAGIKYARGGFYTAVNFAQGHKELDDFSLDHTGIEATLGYSFDNDISLMSLYNKGEAEKEDGTTFDYANSVTAGIGYDLNKYFSVLAEYRLVLQDDEFADDGEGLIINDDELAIAAIYAF